MTTWTKWAGPLVAAIAIVAVGAWAAFVYLGGEEEVPGAATISMGSSNVVFTGGVPSYSGVENIYIVDISETDFTQDFGGATQPATVLATITASAGQTVEIGYGQGFVIVVAVKGHVENMAYLSTENMYMYGSWSGDLSGTENTNVTDNRYIFDNDAGPTNWIEVNHVLDSGGSGWTLSADQSATINVDYYLYGPKT